MNDASNKGRRRLLRLPLIGVAIWVVLFVIPLFVFGVILSQAGPEGPNGGAADWAFGALFKFYSVTLFLVPIIALLLLIYDMINIVRDKSLIFVQRDWYIVLSAFSIISAVISTTVLRDIILLEFRIYLNEFRIYFPFSELSPILSSVASESNPNSSIMSGSNPRPQIQEVFTYVASILIFIVFILTGYISFFKIETESNKRQIALASDIFKTIFGFITGVLATTLRSG